MDVKKCITCSETKALSEYHKHKRMRDGHVNTCKVCARARSVEWNKNNPEKKKAAGRKWARENAARAAELSRNWYLNNKDKVDAYYAEWVKNNPEKVKGYKAKWLSENQGYYEEYCKANKERIKETQAVWIDNNRDRVNASTANWKAANQVKLAAHTMIGNYLRDGKISKPSSCEHCHVFTESLHAHHSDYSKPLDVDWLCVPCHAQWHKENKAVNG